MCSAGMVDLVALREWHCHCSEGLYWSSQHDLASSPKYQGHIELSEVLSNVLLVLVYKALGAAVLIIDLNTIFKAHENVILAGDLNCKILTLVDT